MEDYEPQLCSVEKVKSRALTLKRILEEVCEVTGGIVNMSRLISASTTVEIGCGRGAYGLMVRNLGNVNVIIGVDNVYPYHGETAYYAYTRVIGDDAQSARVMSEIKGNVPDLIIGIGCPPQVNQHIIGNYGKFGLKKGGIIVLITDFEVNDSGDFLIFHGESGTSDNIYVY